MIINTCTHRFSLIIMSIPAYFMFTDMHCIIQERTYKSTLIVINFQADFLNPPYFKRNERRWIKWIGIILMKCELFRALMILNDCGADKIVNHRFFLSDHLNNE
jgi:hypothetical protein